MGKTVSARSLANLRPQQQIGKTVTISNRRGNRNSHLIWLQKAVAMPFRAGPYFVWPEHVGKIVWVLPERPHMHRLARHGVAIEGATHAVIIDVDGSVNWPTPRYALRGTLELHSEKKQLKLKRWREPGDAPIKLRSMRVSDRMSTSKAEQRLPVAERRRVPIIPLVGDWLTMCGFQAGDIVTRESPAPGVLILRRLSVKLPLFISQEE